MEELIEKLEDLLEEKVEENSVLEDFEEWDSLAIITMIGFFDKQYSKAIRASEIKTAKTVKDLYELRK